MSIESPGLARQIELFEEGNEEESFSPGASFAEAFSQRAKAAAPEQLEEGKGMYGRMDRKELISIVQRQKDVLKSLNIKHAEDLT